MFYVFHGDDTHSQRETLDGLTAKLGDPGLLELNTTQFGANVTFSDLRQACAAMPFLAPARVVIVHNALSSKPPKAFLDQLVDYLSQLPSTTRLVFLESEALSEKHPLLRLAEQDKKRGYAKRFDRLQGYQLERWIQQRVADKQGQINNGAASILAANVGSDLQALDTEIEKLVLYKGPGSDQAIEPADVALLSPYAAEASIFDLVDALGNRNAKKASQLLQKKLDEGADPFYLFSMFTRQFRLLIQVKELADAGLNPPAISRELRQHSFVVGKLYQQARGFSMEQLEQIYRHLLEIDVGTKTGEQDMLTALSLLVAGLTMPV